MNHKGEVKQQNCTQQPVTSVNQTKITLHRPWEIDEPPEKPEEKSSLFVPQPINSVKQERNVVKPADIFPKETKIPDIKLSQQTVSLLQEPSIQTSLQKQSMFTLPFCTIAHPTFLVPLSPYSYPTNISVTCLSADVTRNLTTYKIVHPYVQTAMNTKYPGVLSFPDVIISSLKPRDAFKQD